MYPQGQTLLLTILALIAFAANSIFCRLALREGAIDVTSFTCIRLLSGALMLVLLLTLKRRHQRRPIRLSVHPLAALFLFSYAIAFSWAYTVLDTGTGALILFGAVQLTMIGRSMISGRRLTTREGCGLVLAICGLTYLLLPGAQAPSLPAAVAMTLAGMAWGGYTLQGRKSQDALAASTSNFLLALPLILLLSLSGITTTELSTPGVLFAIASGALASGCGYAIWYQVLPALATTTAATVQLAVPMLAAFGGAAFLSEPVSARLLLASSLILGGIALVIWSGRSSQAPK